MRWERYDPVLLSPSSQPTFVLLNHEWNNGDVKRKRTILIVCQKLLIWNSGVSRILSKRKCMLNMIIVFFFIIFGKAWQILIKMWSNYEFVCKEVWNNLQQYFPNFYSRKFLKNMDFFCGAIMIPFDQITKYCICQIIIFLKLWN